MRKKTVNHVADTVFWYVLYFLPIISYLLFCFTEPVKIEQLDTSSTVSVVATADDNPLLLSAGQYVFNDTLDFSIFEGFTSVDIVFDFSSNGVLYDKIMLDPVYHMVFYGDSTAVYSRIWITDNKTIILDADAIFNVGLYKDFIVQNSTYTAPDPIIPATLDIVPFYDYMISTYRFTDGNFIYNTITSLFGEYGVFNLALDNGIYLYFSWFIGVYLMHLFVDFILFIPRLCHKWLKEFTQGD